MSTPITEGKLAVVNIGVDTFMASLVAGGAPAISLDWRPAGDGDPVLGWQLAQMMGDESDPQAIGTRIDRANDEAGARMLAARPMLVDVALHAREVWPELWAKGRKLLTHAGAPVPWAKMCSPMQGTMIGAVLYEGWAKTPEAARELLAAGGVEFVQTHDINAVSPMSGAISPSQPVFIVENSDRGNMAYSNFSEGIGKVLRFGAYGEEVIKRLKWMEDTLAPALKAAVGEVKGGIDLKSLQAQALMTGTEASLFSALGDRAQVMRVADDGTGSRIA